MSYYNPSGELSADSYYSQTPMSLDVNVLRQVYGTSNYGVSGNTTHTVTSSKSWETLVDYNGSNKVHLDTNTGWYLQLTDDTGEFEQYGWGKEINKSLPKSQYIDLMGTFTHASGSNYNDTIKKMNVDYPTPDIRQIEKDVIRSYQELTDKQA